MAGKRGRKHGDGAGPDGMPKAPIGPRRPAVPSAGKLKAPGRGENRPAPSLVIASFLGREHEWVDHLTGEIGKPPVSVGCIEYPDGGGELFGVAMGKGQSSGANQLREMRRRRAEERWETPERAAELAQERQAERAARSAKECARRARCRVRRLCRQYGLDHMVTLTFPDEGVHAYDRALRLLQDFIHDHGHALHRGRAWLAVPELHPGGHGWHWHVLVPRRFTKGELSALRSGWTEYLRRHGMAPSGGATFARIDVKRWTDAAHAAAYAAKYAGKSFDGDDRQKGRKRYVFQKGLDVVVQRGGAQTLDEVRAVIGQIEMATVFESYEDAEWKGPPMVWSSWNGQTPFDRPST